MPRYFFDVEDGERTIDEEGKELAGPKAAALEAMKTMLEVGRFEAVVNNERRLNVLVRDELGSPIYRTEMLIGAVWFADEGQGETL